MMYAFAFSATAWIGVVIVAIIIAILLWALFTLILAPKQRRRDAGLEQMPGHQKPEDERDRDRRTGT